jgi:hypothetical protein
VAAKNFLRDQGYAISRATVKVKKPFQITQIEWVKDHFRVQAPRQCDPEIWTCEKLVIEACALREKIGISSSTTEPSRKIQGDRYEDFKEDA